jgi:hypothetical protein
MRPGTKILDEPRVDLLKIDLEGAEIEMLTTANAARLRAIGQITVKFHGDSVFGSGLHQEVDRSTRKDPGLAHLLGG